MITSQNPNFVGALEILKRGLISRIKSKFQSFFNKRLVDTGLAVRASDYAYDLGFSGSSSHRRSVNKLKTLLFKNLEKNSPFVSFVKNGLIDNSTTDGIHVNLKPTVPAIGGPIMCKKAFSRSRYAALVGNFPDRTNKFTNEQLFSSSRVMNIAKDSCAEFEPLRRYLRYINYLAIKNRVAIRLVLDVLHDIPNPFDEEKDRLIQFKPVLKITTSRWLINNSEVLDRYTNMVTSGNIDDSIYNPSLWGESNLGSLENSDDFIHNISDEDFHISSVFMHLDKCPTLINTLLRKAEYEYQAFNFRTS